MPLIFGRFKQINFHHHDTHDILTKYNHFVNSPFYVNFIFILVIVI